MGAYGVPTVGAKGLVTVIVAKRKGIVVEIDPVTIAQRAFNERDPDANRSWHDAIIRDPRKDVARKFRCIDGGVITQA